MITLLVFLFILSVLVLVHEFGHYIVAKRNGVLVEEFGWGIPPRLFGKKIGETLYSINLLPLGGFVKVFGEDSTEEGSKESPRSFYTKTPRQRLAILSAGVIMNLLLAVLLYIIFFSFRSSKTFYLPVIFDHQFKFGTETRLNTVVTGFSEGSPLEGTSIKPGDAILVIDFNPVENVSDVRSALVGKAGQEVSVVYLRSSELHAVRKVTVVPQANDSGEVLLGVYLAEAVSLSYSNPVIGSFQHLYNMLDYSLSTFGKFISLSFSEKSLEPVSAGVSGPVGIYSIVNAIVSSSSTDVRFLTLLDFMALLSLSLAIMNLLPIPALDGGRIVFVFFEIITRRRANEAIEATIHKWGMILLLFLFFLVTIKDIRMFFF